MVCKSSCYSGGWQTSPADWDAGICRSHPSSPFLLPQRGHDTPLVWLPSSLHVRCCGQSVSNLFTSSTDHKQRYGEAESFKLRPKTPNHLKGYVKKEKNNTKHCLTARTEQVFRRSLSKCSDPPHPCRLGHSLSRDQSCHSGPLQSRAGLLVRLASELRKSRAEPPSLLAFPQPEVKEVPVGTVAVGSALTRLVSLGRIPALPSQCRCETKHKQEQVQLFL